MDSSPKLLSSKGGNPSLYKIKPRCSSGGEVHMVAGMAGQPAMNQGRFMSSIVIHHDMNIKVGRNGFIDPIEELPELYGAVVLMAFSQDLISLGVESSEKRCGSMSRIVVSSAFNLSGTHREQGLHMVEGLNLGLLIHTQNKSIIGRAQVQPHDIPDLIDKEWIRGELEALSTMRLESECPPDAAYCALAQS
jgi:hypothetical protein